MKKGELIFRTLILMFCVGLPMLALAQPDPPIDTPIDGGLTLFTIYQFMHERLVGADISEDSVDLRQAFIDRF